MEQIEEPDIVLIKGCLENDREMQEKLYRKYASSMYQVCLAYSKDKSSAQDILQDSFVKVFRNLEKFNEKGSLEGWIRRIVTNTSIDFYRKQIGNKRMIPFEEVRQKVNIKGSEATESIQYQDIYKQVRRLPEGARMIFNLFAIEGYTHREIADKLDITEGTSKSQVNRARKLLNNWLSEYNQ